MRIFYAVLIVLGIIPTFLMASDENTSYHCSTIQGQVKKATINLNNIDNDYLPSMLYYGLQASDGHRPASYLQELKSKIVQPSKKPMPANIKSDGPPIPTVVNSINGNSYSGVPNDNDIAISNNNWIVSVSNSIVFISQNFQVNNAEVVSLEAFFEPLGIAGNKYDPKVLYDPLQDRFIIVALNGFTSDESYLLVGFSMSNNPNGAWSLYALAGNPLGGTVWTDYPMIAINENDLYITANLLRDNESWQEGFEQTIIWQIYKNDAYNGGDLFSVLYADIIYQERNIRNLCPVREAWSPTGTNMMFLSNRNFDLTNDSIFILNAPNLSLMNSPELTIQVGLSAQAYGLPPDAPQSGTVSLLATNDGRILGAMKHGDNIHFVSTSIGPEYGTAGIYHGTIENPLITNTITAHILEDSLNYYAYPNLSFAGQSTDQEDLIINMNYTAASIYPGASAIRYSDGVYSDVLSIKEGSAYINIPQIASPDRWGDYTGSQRIYNEPGAVLVVGTYGKNANLINNNVYGTWIAKLKAEEAAISSIDQPTNYEFNLYPNPANFEIINIDFEIEKAGIISINLYDMNGKLFHTLFNAMTKAGLNEFRFSTNPIPAGNYLVVISDTNHTLSTKKIVISN